MFTLLGVGFFCVGVIMNLALKKYFPNFYDNFSCVLWLACLLLTLPLLFRAIINFSLNRSTSFSNWWSSNFVATQTIYLILTTYIPIVSQMSSLIFGYLRNKQEKMSNNQHVVGMTGGSPDDTESEYTNHLYQSYAASENRGYFDPPIENYRIQRDQFQLTRKKHSSSKQFKISLRQSQLSKFDKTTDGDDRSLHKSGVESYTGDFDLNRSPEGPGTRRTKPSAYLEQQPIAHPPALRMVQQKRTKTSKLHDSERQKLLGMSHGGSVGLYASSIDNQPWSQNSIIDNSESEARHRKGSSEWLSNLSSKDV